MKKRGLFHSQFGGFKGIVTQFWWGASWLHYIMVDDVRRIYVGAMIPVQEDNRPLHQPCSEHPKKFSHEPL